MRYIISDIEGIETTYTGIEEIQEFIKQPYEYWSAGTGDSAVQVKPGERIIFFKMKQGVFIMQHPDYTAPLITKDQTAIPVLHYVGGEPFNVPDVCLCPTEKAFEIIRYYIESGGKQDPSYNWVNIYDLIKPKTINELIEEIKQLRAKYNLPIPAPINEGSISDFSDKFNQRFGIAVPPEYINFLQICDGLDENGGTIYSSFDHEEDGVLHGIFELNDIWYEQDVRNTNYIYYGDGNQDLYVFDTGTGQYQVLDRYCNDIIESFTSFDEMLVYILKLMIG